MCMCVHVRVYIPVCVYVYIYVHVSVCGMYVYVYVCVSSQVTHNKDAKSTKLMNREANLSLQSCVRTVPS